MYIHGKPLQAIIRATFFNPESEWTHFATHTIGIMLSICASLILGLVCVKLNFFWAALIVFNGPLFAFEQLVEYKHSGKTKNAVLAAAIMTAAATFVATIAIAA